MSAILPGKNILTKFDKPKSTDNRTSSLSSELLDHAELFFNGVF